MNHQQDPPIFCCTACSFGGSGTSDSGNDVLDATVADDFEVTAVDTVLSVKMGTFKQAEIDKQKSQNQILMKKPLGGATGGGPPKKG